MARAIIEEFRCDIPDCDRSKRGNGFSRAQAKGRHMAAIHGIAGKSKSSQKRQLTTNGSGKTAQLTELVIEPIEETVETIPMVHPFPLIGSTVVITSLILQDDGNITVFMENEEGAWSASLSHS